jgi:glucose/arabinose dehydrogenase
MLEWGVESMSRIVAIFTAFLTTLAWDAGAQFGIRLDPVAGGLASPLLVTHAGDGSGRLFVVEQPGRIRIIQNGVLLPGSFLDITSKVAFGGERGLLGLAFHPYYRINGRFYVNYTRAGDGATVLSQFWVSATDPNAANPFEVVLLVIPQPEVHHNGGHLAFGPDRYLYIATGDGGGVGDPHGMIGNGQNTFALLGKILRINVNRSPYTVPADNPFALFNLRYGAGEVYAWGFRNPWRFSFDRATGYLFCADVGQAQIEEIDVVFRGGNYGWRYMEGTACYNPPSGCPTAGLQLPIFEYAHTSGSNGRCSITGGYVYRGLGSPTIYGLYFYGDYCSGEIFALQATGAGWNNYLLLDTALNITSFGEDEAGELYVCNQGGTIHRIVGF